MKIARIFRLALCLSLFGAGTGILPAHASQPAGGDIAFNLLAHLNNFPCGTPGCDGTFNGSMAGSLGGVDGLNQWQVAFIPPSSIGGSFHYSDSCFPAPAIGIAGSTANGSFYAEVN